MNTTPDTALTPLLEKATAGAHGWHVDPKAAEESFFEDVSILRHDGLAVAVAVHNGDILPPQPETNAALITAAVRAIRWAHSEAGVEAIARAIDPSSWRVMDSYLADVKRKYKGQDAGYDPAAFKDRQSMDLARSIVAALAKAGVGE